MPKQNLASLSVDALLKLRDDIGRVLSEKGDELKGQLARLGDWGSSGGRAAITRKGRRSTKGRKVAAKYRGPNGETWAGRGARPRWMQEAIKGGAKPDDFLIAKPAGAAASRKKSAAKTSRKRKAA